MLQQPPQWGCLAKRCDGRWFPLKQYRPQEPALYGFGSQRFILSFGVDELAGCYDDIELTDTVISWGANMAEIAPRSFEYAPLLISHRFDGFLPIKADVNKYRRCQMPDKSLEFKATPLPKTHFTSYQPPLIEKNGI